ncbi:MULTISPECIES: sugar transferase [unclassified Colwellia]|uniref:sugar transferase n=1 Tax=unclassified Colwellia TaxID=196834 RepID=UPI0021750180|nr:MULTISPECIES: sugar transferase [unclassified Colwellia]
MMNIDNIFYLETPAEQDIATNFDLPRQEQTLGKHRGIPLFIQRLIALVALILLTPILLITTVIICLESKGSFLYSQDRIGKYGRHFRMYKFRSMYLKSDPNYQEPDPSQSDRDGVCKKYKKDPRITTMGWFIRKFSIDELPQFYNIIIGDMVLIGPRPALSNEVDEYSYLALGRLNGLPGLSGLWQVSGRADTNFKTQVNLDKSYLWQQSTLLDIKIILATIPVVLKAQGAY